MRRGVLIVVVLLALTGCSGEAPERRAGPGPQPVLGAFHELLLDPTGDGVLLLTGPPEGERAGSPLQLWRWNGAWSRVPAEDPPPDRNYFAATYDTERDVVVLYGGDLPSDEAATVWEWDGAVWSSHARPGPGPRQAPAIAFDADAGLSILYGGDSAGRIHRDTWGWTGTDWTRLARRGPSPARWPGAMVDRAGAGPLLVGGHQVIDESLPAALADSWSWDDGWRELRSAGAPTLVVNAEAIDHPDLGVLLVGGSDLEQANGDVLRWTGDAWELLGEDVFPARQAFGLAYDETRDVVVLTGGVVRPGSPERHQDVWEWSGEPAEPAVRVAGG